MLLIGASTATNAGVAALVALVVSAVVSGGIKFLFDDLLASRKAERDYRYERQKELHALVGSFDGRLLESGTDLLVRLRNIAVAAHPRWLESAPGKPLGYFLASTVYRFVALMRLAIAFDREAIYFEPGIASPHDLLCIRYAKAFQWAMTDVRLFADTGYEDSESTDHFFRDALRTSCSFALAPEKPLTYEVFCERVLGDPRIEEVVAFFDGFGKTQTPYRWDRVIALQLLLAACIDVVGYDESHKKPQAEFDAIAQGLTSKQIKRNLLGWFSEQLSRVDKKGLEKIRKAVESAKPPSA